jgi:hypothetical protein
VFQPHKSRPWWILVAVYFSLRALSSLGRESSRFADTFGFFNVDYFGRESRLWPVSVIYSAITNDTARVAVHIFIGTIAWAFLAHVIARKSRYPHLVSAIVFAFGLTPQIVRFDLAILSESIGLSLLVIFIATSLQFLTNPSRFNLGLWVVALTCFSMTRTSQLIVLFSITAFVLLRLIQKRSRSSLIFASCLTIISLWGALQLHNNRSMSELNFYTVLQERVIEDDKRFDWFVAEGMPFTNDLRQPLAYDNLSDLPGELLDYIQLPIAQLPPTLMRLGGLPLAEWVRNDGWTTYARYLVTHPSDTWSRLSTLSGPTLNPLDRDLLPIDSRSTFLKIGFLPWQWWLIGGFLAALLHIRFGQRFYSRFFIWSMLSAFVWYSGVVLTSGIEHPRHAITVSVAIRLVSLLTILGLLERVSNATTTEDETVIR